jgi:hypothetical protein
VILEPLDQLAHAGARLRQRRVGDHEVCADDADGHGAGVLLERLERRDEAPTLRPSSGWSAA